MLRILKYGIPEKPGRLETILPLGAMFLAGALQRGRPVAWFLVPTAPAAGTSLALVETGDEAPAGGRYLCTYLLADGAYVLHLFALDGPC